MGIDCYQDIREEAVNPDSVRGDSLIEESLEIANRTGETVLFIGCRDDFMGNYFSDYSTDGTFPTKPSACQKKFKNELRCKADPENDKVECWEVSSNGVPLEEIYQDSDSHRCEISA